jgi:hypothetical protein
MKFPDCFVTRFDIVIPCLYTQQLNTKDEIHIICLLYGLKIQLTCQTNVILNTLC